MVKRLAVFWLYLRLWQNQIGANRVRWHIAYCSPLPGEILHLRFIFQTRFAVLCELWPLRKWERKICFQGWQLDILLNECQLLVSFKYHVSILLNQGLPQTLQRQRRKYGKLHKSVLMFCYGILWYLLLFCEPLSGWCTPTQPPPGQFYPTHLGKSLTNTLSRRKIQKDKIYYILKSFIMIIIY